MPKAVATRQTSSSGRPKSPRIQVVLSEPLFERLAAAADQDSRTVSNMAKVLIQQGLDRLQGGVRHQLEHQQKVQPRLRHGRLRRIRLRGG